MGRVKVILKVMEGEVSKMGRFEFPHPYYIQAILKSTPVEEQKKYVFHWFNNILVAKKYSNEVEGFLMEGARNAGFELEIVRWVE